MCISAIRLHEGQEIQKLLITVSDVMMPWPHRDIFHRCKVCFHIHLNQFIKLLGHNILVCKRSFRIKRLIIANKNFHKVIFSQEQTVRSCQQCNELNIVVNETPLYPPFQLPFNRFINTNCIQFHPDSPILINQNRPSTLLM